MSNIPYWGRTATRIVLSVGFAVLASPHEALAGAVIGGLTVWVLYDLMEVHRD